MTGRPADPLTRLSASIQESRRRYGLPDIDERYPAALLEGFFIRDAVELRAAVERLVEASGPMANLPSPVSADERQQWIIRQNQLRDALALFDRETKDSE